ncbi:aminoglycoside phosphotransferase family protein [Rhizorhabdus dicambivorans]|uniref:Aminoglycoside phosphotransferase n=1 Tax=Rhizorhabdus dicambivorans TaxID=1850238 RepID=A0A2A4G1G9_9SPHN|nr:phosphotransferase [Rhizorhabdus dicambivorans]ATE63410.1 aminoglycoside phosphotransferase [Rhizorhabdus dicambivorans]PCE43627.1 aminoglycoside phosphotransferase [Rhizorhabdus dicambivorans]
MIPPPHAFPFLDRAGWSDAEVLPLAGDASFRRYFRVLRGGETAVLMDAPPEHEDSRPFLAVARHLAAIGFRAPRVLAEDLEQGLILLEDFGDARMKEVIDADPLVETHIYGEAIDLLADLHGHAAGPLPPYDMAVYQREAALFPEWYMPAVGLDPDMATWQAAWHDALAPIAADHSISVLRDYHAENIMLLGNKDLGLLDFQDALAGHPAYDLVSLLQDARRDVAPELEAAMIARYAARRPFDEAAYALLGAQRNTKILGIFTRLWKRDGKRRYLDFQPRVWGYLERDLAHPALGPVKAWFDAHVPAARRAPFDWSAIA